MTESSREQELAAISAKLKELLVSHLALRDVTPEQIQTDAPLFGEGLGLDSLDAVEIAVILQRHFNIQIKDMEVGRQVFQTVASLANFILDNRPAATPPSA